MGDVSGLTAVSAGQLLVGVSISEPSEEELISLGLSEIHIRHAFVEIVRHVLAAGWSIAYGGDFRPQGYTEALLDLVRTYERSVLSGPDRVSCYLAWPRWTELTDADTAELANIATVVPVPPPVGAPDSLPPFGDRTSDERLWNAVALTAMRQQMASNLDAVIVLGGRTAGQQGLMPGVLEEVATALSASVPVFVAGGFGGCGHLVARALAGMNPTEFSVEYHLAHTDNYSELLEAATLRDLAPDFGTIVETLSSGGFGELRNGLDESANMRLLATDDIDELISLVLRGLFKIAGDTDP
jgi:hypothetical protein